MMQTDDTLLQVRKLSTGYRGRPVIQALDLPDIHAGQLHSLIGPNAAGKSTLLRALAGLQPATGSIRLGGQELVRSPLAQHTRHVTYMPQTLPQGVALTVLESVVSARQASPMGEESVESAGAVQQRAAQVLDRIGILPLAMEGLNRLSGGQRQLVSLAQALIREPRVLLLDEPISALDLHYQLRVMRLVHELARERGMMALVVLHDLQVAARWSDGIVVLSGGAIAAAGTPQQAITPDVLARVYNVDARIESCSHGMLQIMVDNVMPVA